LLEVNHAPSFNSDTPFDKLNKSRLLEGTFKLVGMCLKTRNELNNFEK